MSYLFVVVVDVVLDSVGVGIVLVFEVSVPMVQMKYVRCVGEVRIRQRVIIDDFSAEPLLSTADLDKYFLTTIECILSHLLVFDVIQLLTRVLVLDLILGNAIEGYNISVDPLQITLDSDHVALFVRRLSSNTI